MKITIGANIKEMNYIITFEKKNGKLFHAKVKNVADTIYPSIELTKEQEQSLIKWFNDE